MGYIVVLQAAFDHHCECSHPLLPLLPAFFALPDKVFCEICKLARASAPTEVDAKERVGIMGSASC